MKEIYMLYPKISPNKTGIVVSMLRRADLLANAGYKVFLFTMEHDVSTRLHFNECYTTGLLTNHENIQFINVFSFFQKKQKDDHCLIVGKPEVNCTFDIRNNRIYKDDNNKRYEVFNGDKLIHTNIFHEGLLINRIKYDDYGKMCCLQTLLKKKVMAEQFYNIYGKIVLKIDYTWDKDKKNISSILLFDQYGMIEKVFSSLIDLANYTIHKYICNNPEKLYYFFIDRIRAFKDFLYLDHPPNYFLIGTIHAAHYVDPKDIFSAPNRNYTPYFKNINKLSALIILTELQKQDIIKVYGESNCYKVIPHSLSQEPIIYKTETNFLQFVSLARYDKVKRLDLLIDIFSEVVQVHPAAKLNLYGFGDELNALQGVIEQKEMANSIQLFPFEKNVNQLLQSSSMLLLATQSESFCLVVMEALANGCPVTSFDIRYGPSEMIQHNDNGYLVEEGDKASYVKTLIEYLNQPKNQKLEMREKAKQHSRCTASSEVVLKKWMILFDEIEVEYRKTLTMQQKKM